MWFAIPSSQWTCTTYSLPVSRRTCVKNARGAKDAQNCFLNFLLPTWVDSATGFYIDEIEIEILRAS
jgi:hypothetical protein